VSELILQLFRTPFFHPIAPEITQKSQPYNISCATFRQRKKMPYIPKLPPCNSLNFGISHLWGISTGRLQSNFVAKKKYCGQIEISSNKVDFLHVIKKLRKTIGIFGKPFSRRF